MKYFVRLFIFPIRFYQRFISPLTPPSCRFTPPARNTLLKRCRNMGFSKAFG